MVIFLFKSLEKEMSLGENIILNQFSKRRKGEEKNEN